MLKYRTQVDGEKVSEGTIDDGRVTHSLEFGGKTLSITMIEEGGSFYIGMLDDGGMSDIAEGTLDVEGRPAFIWVNKDWS